ncbi:MAG: hypothetical protein KatS3mg108_1911 [Isosphaeraceae bacterium]|jgi:hypothetical protein|nr:MAG: hypothetical protein KatS3mg108_1911 [Isosphaeraceae bacterium]
MNAGLGIYWFFLPLAVAISLVYSASRHEPIGQIVRNALRLFGKIVAFMIVTTIVLLLINTQV